jgi:hypothetical protein
MWPLPSPGQTKKNLLQQFWINDCVIAIIVVIVDWVDGTKVGSPT